MNTKLVKITPEILDVARTRDIEAGPAYAGASIEGGKGRFPGFLGEGTAKNGIIGSIFDNTEDYDLRIRNFTIDVKTKTRKDYPEHYFDGTVDESCLHQKPDFFVFVQILAPWKLTSKTIEEIRNFDYQKGWIIGWISREKFF